MHRIAAVLFASVAALPLWAGESWEAIRDELYPGQILLDAGRLIAIDAPMRSPDDARTQVAASVSAPEGSALASVMVVVDENPMPVSAVFRMDRPLTSFFFDVTLRFNGPSGLHVLAETVDGRVFVAESFVKTSGQGACAAPPGTDPEAALATLGQMQLGIGDLVPGAADARTLLTQIANRTRSLDIDISHPSHSGMQRDQVSLLYIPLRYVDSVEIDLDGSGYVDVTGSISLSEDPRLRLSVPGQTRRADVTMTDTSGTVSHAHADLAGF